MYSVNIFVYSINVLVYDVTNNVADINVRRIAICPQE